ncbi:MAG: hypothetical protein PWQ43_49 [Rikenellaceae bacterium]|nr:hypothetical protein [Rikenellaceae bacterium]MDN5355107.1 hypothetical protein [Rikenellaceae bacterium]
MIFIIKNDIFLFYIKNYYFCKNILFNEKNITYYLLNIINN